MIDLNIPINRHIDSNSNSVSEAKICKCTTARTQHNSERISDGLFFYRKACFQYFCCSRSSIFPLELLTVFFGSFLLYSSHFIWCEA
jgi:hypothetical protein